MWRLRSCHLFTYRGFKASIVYVSWPSTSRIEFTRPVFATLGAEQHCSLRLRLLAGLSPYCNLRNLATLRTREHELRPDPDYLLEAPPFAGTDPALVPARGQPGQTIRSRREDPGALLDLEPRHVLCYLVLTLEGGVRHPYVSADGAFARLLHDHRLPLSLLIQDHFSPRRSPRPEQTGPSCWQEMTKKVGCCGQCGRWSVSMRPMVRIDQEEQPIP